MGSVRRDDFDFPLPRELIARHPCEPRDAARLLVIPAAGGLERISIGRHRYEQPPSPFPLPARGRAVRGNRGVNQLVAGACPARRRFSVYFLVYETQKEDGACASHLASSVSCWNRSSGVNSTRWWRVTPAMPTSNRLRAGTICWRWSTPSSPRPSACAAWKRVGMPTVSII